MVTVGGSEAIDIALGTMLDEGDEVLIPQPELCFIFTMCIHGRRSAENNRT